MKKILLGFVLVFATLFTSVWAEDNPRAVIIFDASGSMWGQINGKTKIEIGRDALKNVVNEWNPSVELGLTVYGHRTKGDCNDIETVIPVGKVDKKKFLSTVMAIKPKGKTPISRSLRKVAEEIKYTEEKATIILISDGKETCDPDPCATAKELEKQGIDFVTHVIGFNVDKKTDMQLECIADATGGEYFSAKDATALNEAMKVIVKKVEVVEAPKPVVKKLKINLEVTTSETEGGKWVKATNYVYTVEDGKADSHINSAHSNKKKAGTSKLPVGNYILKSSYNAFKKETPFEIKAGEITKVNVVFGQTGTVEVSASETEGGKWVKATNYVYTVEDGKVGERAGNAHSRKKDSGKDILPVGNYILKSAYNAFKKETPFEIKAGEITKVNVVFGQTGTVEVSASEKEGGKWVKATNYVYIVEDGKVGERAGSAHSRKKDSGKDILPVGNYILKSSYNKFKKETPFVIKAGEVTKVNVVFGQTGTVEITASEKEGGKWVRASNYISKDDEGKPGESVTSAHSSKKAAGTATIPVGKYIIRTSYKGFKKLVPFEIKAGETTKVHVTFSQLIIEAKCSDMGAKVNYEIYASSGRLVYEKQTKCSDTLKVTLDNGDYTVEAKIDNDIKEEKFTVGGGSSKLIIDMRDIKKEPTKEELIKADSVEPEVTSAPKQEEQKSEKITIGDKQIEIKGISQKDADKLKELGAILGAFGGMMQGTNPEEQKKQQEKQSADNAKADKEFDEMSKELDMFTK